MMEKAMAPHSSILAWKIPWMEEPGRLQSMGSLRVGHDWATPLSLYCFLHWRSKWQPTPVFLPGESQGWGSLLESMGSHRVGHDWSDLAAAAAAESMICVDHIVEGFAPSFAAKISSTSSVTPVKCNLKKKKNLFLAPNSNLGEKSTVLWIRIIIWLKLIRSGFEVH